MVPMRNNCIYLLLFPISPPDPVHKHAHHCKHLTTTSKLPKCQYILANLELAGGIQRQINYKPTVSVLDSVFCYHCHIMFNGANRGPWMNDAITPAFKQT